MMTKDQIDQIKQALSRRIGKASSLVSACEWMLNDDEDLNGRHCLLIHAPVPSVKPHVPNLASATPSFSAILVKTINERFVGDAPLIYKRAGVPRQIYHKIASDETAAVAKRTAIRFAFALRLSFADAERLLNAAGYALSDSIAEDVILKACLCANPPVHDFADVDALLYDYGVDYAYGTK